MASTFIIGTEGADLLNGAAGNDTIRGLGGNDTINGSEGNDDLDGGDGNDSLIGGAGNDVIQGGKGADTILGGAGGDIIRGGKGQDSLDGGEGNDTLYSGYGQDTLTGGSGSDVFVLKGKQDAANPAALVTPTITDFVAGTDTIAIEGVTSEEITAALAGQTTVDGGVSFKIGDGTIVVKGTGLTTLTSANVTTTSAIPDAPVAGSTFTLTTGTDVVAGTSGNDTIIGDFSATTVNASDQIDGGAGTDTLRLFGNLGNLPAGVSNVEVLNLVNPGNFDINLTTIGAPSGLTKLQVSQVEAAGGKSITTTGYNGVTLDLATLNNNSAGGALTWAASTTDTTLNLELSGYSNATAQSLDITGAAATTLNITTDTAASKFTTLTGPATATTVNLAVGSGANLTVATLSAAAAKTVNISGAGKATISASDLAATVTVDASTNTGGVTYTGEAGSTLTFKGGSGNDQLNIATADITTADTLTGGAGTDTIALSTAATLTGTVAAAGVNKATGFESLQFGASSSVDVGFITNGITNFKAATGNVSLTATNSLATTTYTVDNSAGNTGTVSVSNKVGETSASVTIDAGAAVANQTLNTLTFTGVTNVNLVSTGTGTGSANTITTLATSDNSVITITGSKALTLTDAIDGTATGSKVDASALTGKLTMTGSGFADVIIGGTAADSLLGGAGDDTISSGDGNDYISSGTGADVITTGAGNDLVEMTANASVLTFATVTDFAAGDALSFANKGTETFNTAAVSLGGGSTLTDYMNAAAAGNGGTNGIVRWFQFEGNTYVVQDLSAGATFVANTDRSIKLTGLIDLSTATLSTADNTLTNASNATGTTALIVNQTITGTAGDDNLVGGEGNDTITGLAGRDTMDGGGGVDTFVYTAVDQGGPVGAGGVFGAGDTINNFTAAGAAGAVERLDFTGITNIQNVVGGQASFESVASGSATGTNTVILINSATALDLTNTGNVIGAIGNFSGNAAGFAAGDVHIFIVGNGAATQFGIYAYTEADGAATLDQADFRLLGIVNNVGTGFDGDNIV